MLHPASVMLPPDFREASVTSSFCALLVTLRPSRKTLPLPRWHWTVRCLPALFSPLPPLLCALTPSAPRVRVGAARISAQQTHKNNQADAINLHN